MVDAGGNTGHLSRRTALKRGAITVGCLLTASRSAAAEPTEIDECTTIEGPGEYVLTDDLSADGNCLTIRGATLDGNGHTISGNGTGKGIAINSEADIRDLHIRGFRAGIYDNHTGSGSDISLKNSVVSDNSQGIALGRLSNLDMQDSIIRDNGGGIQDNEGSQINMTQCTLSGNDSSAISTAYGNTVTMNNCTVTENGRGILTGEGEFRDSTIARNGGKGITLTGYWFGGARGSATIVGNEIRDNSGAGIDVIFSNADVRENTISVCVYPEDSTDGTA